MTLPRDATRGYTAEQNNTNQGVYIINYDPKLTKPTARIVPLSTTTTTGSSYHVRDSSGPNRRRFDLDPIDLSEDIATANIKTKINQFEYLASRNYDRCPKFPIDPRDIGWKSSVYRQNAVPGKGYKEVNGVNDSWGKESKMEQDIIASDEDPEQVERKRLEEILTICAEYEKQAQLERSTKLSPNRIKTNGSLPRERRLLSTSVSTSSNPDRSPLKLPDSADISSPFSFENSSASSVVGCSPMSGKRVFDFNVGNKEAVDYDSLFTDPGRKNHPAEHVSRNRIKTVTTPFKEGRSTEAYSPQSPVIDERRRFNLAYDKPPDKCQPSSPSVNSFKYLTLPKDTKLVAGSTKYSTLDVENLIAMRKDMERAMIRLKSKLSENENYFEEIVREFELEKALLIGEYKSLIVEKRTLEARQTKCAQRVQHIETAILETQLHKDRDQMNCGEKLSHAQADVRLIEAELSAVPKDSDRYQTVFDKYLVAQEVLDNERKAFEDVEFHHLEKEADLLASKEELQREIKDLVNKIEDLNMSLKDLKMQVETATDTHSAEYKKLETQRLDIHKRIEETRSHLKTIDLDMNCNASPTQTISEPDYSHCSGLDEDSDDSSSGSYVLRNHRLPASTGLTDCAQNDLGNGFILDNMNMTQSVNENMFQQDRVFEENFKLEKKTPSQGDIDRICKVTSSSPMNIIDDSVNLGKKTIESLMEIERNRHLHLVETGSEVIEHERRRVSELKQKAQQEVRSEWARRKPEFSSTLNSIEQNSNISDDENNSKGRNSSDNSVTTTKEMEVESPPTGTFKRSTPKDKQRPLTRYLPIKSADLDLRQHIVTAGHQVILCTYVSINASVCRGFLHKKRSKFNNWSRRWFVFDRTKRSLVYYTDKHEKKARGGTYFQAIEDVYLDHSNSIKSPSPHLTFVMKTQQRTYYLMAPSPEAMRIWIDVIFTGAEGYCGFGQNF